MRQASECFVDLDELQAAVGRRIAELTRNEAAFVSGGAAAGLFLSAVVCMARDTTDGILRPADLVGRRRDILIHRGHRIPYDPSLELAGARLVEFGGLDGTSEADLERAIDDRTAAVLVRRRRPPGGGRAATGDRHRDRAPPRHPRHRRRGRPAPAGRQPVGVHIGRRRPRPVQRGQGAVRSSQHGTHPGPAQIRGPVRRHRGPAAADRPADESRQGGPDRHPGGGRVVHRPGPRRCRASVRGDRGSRDRMGSWAGGRDGGPGDTGPGGPTDPAGAAHPGPGDRAAAGFDPRRPARNPAAGGATPLRR